MLQGIRATTLTVPNFGHSLSLTGVQKMDGYPDVDPWSWSASQSNTTQSYPAIFDPSIYQSTSNPPQGVQPRHHSIATSHVVSRPAGPHTQTATPPPQRQQVAGNVVKAQPAFRPTWHGFLDTTKDAMTIVEAALQGRLSHISRRPHDKERADMLTSGTVLVYEENASGIKRWTDAVHWSPSRVMNNCLIYRQLNRALKPEEKKAALNPSCGSKRKRKESASPAVTNTGETLGIAEDEYEHSAMEAPSGDVTPESYGRVYANYAQTLTPDQQRRFCGSLVDSYEFKEGGLMKKTISVKYQGTHHHIISYYSLEDVVSGKLKRPFQDPNLADIHPRPELLSGWKVSLDDEENKDTPLFASYSQHIQPGHVQQSPVDAGTHGLPMRGMAQTPAQVHLQMPSDYWHGGHVQQYASPQQTPPDYTPSDPTTSTYSEQVPQQYPTGQAPTQQYHSQQYSQPPQDQSYPQGPSPQHYPSQVTHTPQYPAHPAQTPGPPPQYITQPQATQHYPSVPPVPQYPDQHASQQYPESQHAPITQQPQFIVPLRPYDVPIPVPQTHSIQQSTQSPVQQHEPHRRASAPVTMQSYGQPQPPSQYPPDAKQQAFYIPESYEY